VPATQEEPELVTLTVPGAGDAPAVVLLHGIGGDETSLLDLASRACPGRELVAVRGRVPAGGGYAFFLRHPDRSLDEDDLARGARAVLRLLRRSQQGDRRPPVLLGFSNGAITAAAVLALDHHLVSGAVLLRPLSPRPGRGFPQLDGLPVLLVSGDDDERRGPRDAPLLADQLRAAGARTELHALPTGHLLTAADEALVRQWLEGA
jgi:phospholipase/carboxylesterase